MTTNAEPEDPDLMSFEKLDRASPDLWPEQIPGVSEFAAAKSPLSGSSTPSKLLSELENEDIGLLQEFGSLTTSQLMEKIRGLQNLAYQLGLDEESSFIDDQSCFQILHLASKRNDQRKILEHFTKK